MFTRVSFLFLLSISCVLRAQTIASVVSAAAPGAGLAPGSLAAVNGTGLGDSAHVTVTVGGRPAPVLAASTTQHIIQIPFEAQPGVTTLQFGDAAPVNITLVQYAPAFYTSNGLGYGNLSGTHADGSPIDANNPAFPGETVTLMASGLGPTNPPLATGSPGPSNPSAATAVQPEVVYASENAIMVSSVMAPGKVGIYLVTVRLTTAPVTGTRAIGIKIAGVSSGFAASIPIAMAYAKPAITAVLSATGNLDSIQNAIQAGSWASIYGSNFTAFTKDWTDAVNGPHLPTALAGVKVTIDGKPAAVSYISPTQINVQTPAAAAGRVDVVVTNIDQASEPAKAEVRTHAPAFFQWGASKYAVATRYPDYAWIGPPSLGSQWTPAMRGEILILWCTGFGPTDPVMEPGWIVTGARRLADAVKVNIGGVEANFIDAGLSPGSAGLYQIAVQVPSGIPAGDARLTATIGGYSSPENVYIYVD